MRRLAPAPRRSAAEPTSHPRLFMGGAARAGREVGLGAVRWAGAGHGGMGAAGVGDWGWVGAGGRARCGCAQGARRGQGADSMAGTMKRATKRPATTRSPLLGNRASDSSRSCTHPTHTTPSLARHSEHARKRTQAQARARAGTCSCTPKHRAPTFRRAVATCRRALSLPPTVLGPRPPSPSACTGRGRRRPRSPRPRSACRRQHDAGRACIWGWIHVRGAEDVSTPRRTGAVRTGAATRGYQHETDRAAGYVTWAGREGGGARLVCRGCARPSDAALLSQESQPFSPKFTALRLRPFPYRPLFWPFPVGPCLRRVSPASRRRAAQSPAPRRPLHSGGTAAAWKRGAPRGPRLVHQGDHVLGHARHVGPAPITTPTRTQSRTRTHAVTHTGSSASPSAKAQPNPTLLAEPVSIVGHGAGHGAHGHRNLTGGRPGRADAPYILEDGRHVRLHLEHVALQVVARRQPLGVQLQHHPALHVLVCAREPP